MIPKLITNGTELDFELAELLGEKPSSFLILCANGEPVDGYGTPFDSPCGRESRGELVERLNDKSEGSWWPEFFANWKPYFCRQFALPETTTAKEFHPEFSFAVSRTVCGYSEHLSAAIRLPELLGKRLSCWSFGHVGGIGFASMNGITEEHESLPMAIALAARRILTERPKK